MAPKEVQTQHRAPEWSDWSDWTWDEGSNRYYSSRYNKSNGKYDYRYPEAPLSTTQSTPRSPDVGAVHDYSSSVVSTSPAYTTSPSNTYPNVYPSNIGLNSTHGTSASSYGSLVPQDTRSSALYPPSTSYTAADATLSLQGFHLGSPSTTSTASPYSSHQASSPSLDIRYKEVPPKNQKKFWRNGRVFRVLWTEPARDRGSAGVQPAPSEVSVDQYSKTQYLGGTIFTEVRPYVIVQAGYGSSVCCPIHTYGGRATFKRNLPNVSQHAIIYTSQNPPNEVTQTDQDGTIRSENLYIDPIKVKSEQQGEEGDLGHLSRVNFSKVYTIEHYVKVLNIGMVASESMEGLLTNSPLKKEDSGNRSHDAKGKGKSSNKDEKRKHKHSQH